MAGVAPPTFFVDYKKGEVNEIKALLRAPATEKDPNKKKDIVKKVVAFMTMGIDMSELFPDMIMCSRTKDVVQKKLVYLYITHYAHIHENQATALLAVNTLQKDCQDGDPMIRGLALRTLCSLRVKNLMEYSLTCIKPGLEDNNAYVRRAAVIGCLKMYHISPCVIKSPAYVDPLYDMLRDRDPQVISNCIQALEEIQQDTGGIPVNKQIVHYLLNRLKDFNEWGQCSVLNLVARYVPEDKDEVFDIMNLLEDTFRNSNSALVMAATKVFLNLTQSMPTVHEQVLVRLKAPLITLMTSGSDEVAYLCICHLKLLSQRAPRVFVEDIMHFFCRGNDLSCVKELKVDVLVNIVSPVNMGAIVDELSQYVTDVDVSLARHAIRAIGLVAFAVPEALEKCVFTLKSFLAYDIEYVSAESITTLRDIIRRNPGQIDAVLNECVDAFKNVEEADAKCAIVWMLGLYGEKVESAPYILENMARCYDEETASVKNELLSSAVQLFFKRAPETRPALGLLLFEATQDTMAQDVRDRALLIARLLQWDINEAKRVTTGLWDMGSHFPEDRVLEVQDRLFEEFNTCSVVYGRPSSQWMKKHGDVEEEKVLDDLGDVDESAYVDDVGYDVGADMGGAMGMPVQAPTLDGSFELEGATFEQSWGTLGDGEMFNGAMQQGFGGAEQMVSSLRDVSVKTMAFGEVDGIIKFYLYARFAQDASVVMSEMIVTSASMTYAVTSKSANPATTTAFNQWFSSLLAQL